ncbi:MAG: dTDP-4-dehydrorhamnose reductase [Sphingomicrobium sp.]
MKLFVTGMHGQLALALAERNRGRFELVASGRPALDLEQPGSAAAAIGAARPDVIINAAAYTSVDRAEDQPRIAARINGDAAGEVARAGAQLEIPVVQISTDYVFDGSRDGPRGEDCATSPLGAYGRTKLAGEEQVRAANPRHVIVRTAWVYSPFRHNFVKSIMAAACVRDVLTVVDDQHGNPTSALDLADGLLTMVERWRTQPELGLGETYHLAGTGSTSWFGFAAAVMTQCARLGLPTADVKPISSADWPTPAKRPRNSRLLSDKFARDFDFWMPRWEPSLAKVVERLADG